MSDPVTPVTQDELHAFVDGELPADRREAVLAWLETHPEDAALVAAWRAQAEAIRARYAGIAGEQIPDRLKLDRLTQNRWRWRGIAAAAVLVAFAIGGFAGWMARGASAAAPDGFELFGAEALAAHRLYIGEVRHPIEVNAGEAHLLPWLSRRLGTQIRAPELAAFDLRLLGGRLLPGTNGPAALFMYENGSGERFTLYCSRLEAARSGLRYTSNENFGAIHWVEGGYGYVISGPNDKPRLKTLARSAYEQMENRTPPAPNRSSSSQLISRRGS